MTSFIHQTDIFHPHGDPDDHWDLATVYAFAARQTFELQGIMFDYPPEHRAGDPAALAMAQLGYLTGVTGVPFTVGSAYPMRNRKDNLRDRNKRNRAAAEWLCHMLERSEEPIVINIVGSCTDVALAGLLRPDLFSTKCKAVYLNAGAAHPGADGGLEYNVQLNPGSYAAIFDLPCSVYWCPCWHQTEMRQVGSNGTWYSFVQGDVFAGMNEPLCNYFLYMLSRSDDPKYLRYLNQPVDPKLKLEFGQQSRYMWSTASILHAAGMGVDVEKGLLPYSRIKEHLFEFTPITVECSDDGNTTWEKTGTKSDRYIFNIHYVDLYQKTMTDVLSKLLAGL